MEMPYRPYSEKIQTLGFLELSALSRFLCSYPSYGRWYLTLGVSQDFESLRTETTTVLFLGEFYNVRMSGAAQSKYFKYIFLKLKTMEYHRCFKFSITCMHSYYFAFSTIV